MSLVCGIAWLRASPPLTWSFKLRHEGCVEDQGTLSHGRQQVPRRVKKLFLKTKLICLCFFMVWNLYYPEANMSCIFLL